MNKHFLALHDFNEIELYGMLTLARELKAKQKLKGYYGNISEKQFRKYYAEAVRMKGDSGANLIGLLERRLDAMGY